MKKTYILGIDTSCDDTSVAVLENDKVLANVVSSQIDIHKEWGGVVPNLARREHEKMIGRCTELALKRSKCRMSKGSPCSIDAIAVTYGPGLAPALEVGIAWAKKLSVEHELPLIAVDHMEGHALSVFLENKKGKNYSGMEKPEFPFLALCVSGGHTELVWAEKIGQYKILGQTLDDAAGEAFDKIARMLDLGYPGGEVISKFADRVSPKAGAVAQNGGRNKYPLPRPMLWSKDYDFSFSGLKTACLYNTNDLKKQLGKDFAKIIPDYCASVQEAIVDCLVGKTVKAIKEFKPRMLVLGGGVAANKRLRSRMRQEAKKLSIPVYFPDKHFTSDNAAMIALAGYYKFLRKEFEKDVKRLERVPSLRLE